MHIIYIGMDPLATHLQNMRRGSSSIREGLNYRELLIYPIPITTDCVFDYKYLLFTNLSSPRTQVCETPELYEVELTTKNGPAG